MKSSISKKSSVITLKRNEFLEANGFYLIGSESTAQNLYFETKADIKYAHSKVKEHLNGVMDIISYLFTETGFLLLVRTKSKEQIIKSYSETQKRHRRSIRFQDPGPIISEKIRHAISSIVGRSNQKNGRSGTRVNSNFMRFIFSSIEGAKSIMKEMLNEQIDLCRQRRKYRPKFTYWNRDGLLSCPGDIFLSTIKMRNKSVKICEKITRQIIEFQEISLHVLQKVIENTLLLHSGPIPNLFITNSC